MFGMIKFAIGLALLVMAFTVPLGKRTFAGHVRAIWSSDEGKDLRDGVNEKVDEFKKDSKEMSPPTEPVDDELDGQRPEAGPARRPVMKKTRRPRRRSMRTRPQRR